MKRYRNLSSYPVDIWGATPLTVAPGEGVTVDDEHHVCGLTLVDEDGEPLEAAPAEAVDLQAPGANADRVAQVDVPGVLDPALVGVAGQTTAGQAATDADAVDAVAGTEDQEVMP